MSLVGAWAREAERAGAAAGVEAVAQLFGYLSAIESEELREDVMGLRKTFQRVIAPPQARVW